MELSETFWLTLMASGVGILGLVIKKLSSSKCDQVDCFGIHIHRRVEMEGNMNDGDSKADDGVGGVRPSAI